MMHCPMCRNEHDNERNAYCEGCAKKMRGLGLYDHLDKGVFTDTVTGLTTTVANFVSLDDQKMAKGIE